MATATATTEHYDTVCSYVEKNYPQYKGSTLIVLEKNDIFFVSKHIDESPLILSKAILG